MDIVLRVAGVLNFPAAFRTECNTRVTRIEAIVVEIGELVIPNSHISTIFKFFAVLRDNYEL